MNNRGLHLDCDFKAPDQAILNEAISALTSGRLVVAPTETVYALLARADLDDAVQLLFRAKGRPAHLPTAIFVGSIDDLFTYGLSNNIASVLAHGFLPGPLTLVLQALEKAPPQVVANSRIGLRLSSSPVIKALVDQCDFPITATSANISGSDAGRTISIIAADMGSLVSVYVDAGALGGASSTVVDCSEDSVHILRAGAITAEAIDRALKDSPNV